MKNLRQVIKESISESKPKSKPIKEGKGNEIVTDKTIKEVEKILKSKEAKDIVYDAFGDDKKNAKLFLKYSLSDGIIGFLESYREEDDKQTMADLLSEIDSHIFDSEAEIPINFLEDWAELPDVWEDDDYDRALKATEGLYNLLCKEFGIRIK